MPNSKSFYASIGRLEAELPGMIWSAVWARVAIEPKRSNITAALANFAHQQPIPLFCLHSGGALPIGDDDDAEVSDQEQNLHLSSSSGTLVSASSRPSILTLSGERVAELPSPVVDSNMRRSQQGQDIIMATHVTRDAFHAGPQTHLVERELQGKHLRKDCTFFRILDGNMAKHTVQGQGWLGEKRTYDFMIQVYSAFTKEAQEDHPATCVYAWAVGLPLTWDTGEISFDKLVSDLQLWNICGTEYFSKHMPNLSWAQCIKQTGPHPHPLLSPIKFQD